LYYRRWHSGIEKSIDFIVFIRSRGHTACLSFYRTSRTRLQKESLATIELNLYNDKTNLLSMFLMFMIFPAVQETIFDVSGMTVEDLRRHPIGATLYPLQEDVVGLPLRGCKNNGTSKYTW
jgi:hypothetical protein